MHPITAKLILLERTETFVASGSFKGAQASLREQAKRLRRELPAQVVAVFDRLKAEGKEAIVTLFESRCGGCQAPLSKVALERLEQESETVRCEACGRFLYLAIGHELKPHQPSPEVTRGLTTKGHGP